jgi:hypothetical protein
MTGEEVTGVVDAVLTQSINDSRFPGCEPKFRKARLKNG